MLYRACWRLGAIAAPLHHQLGASDVERARDAVRPKVVVDDLDVLPDGVPVTEPWTDREQLAAVLFTSGSSGAPKGVLHTQATLAYKATLMARRARPRRRRLRAHARARRAHLGTAQRHHAPRRRAVPHGLHGALGSGGRARAHRARAGHVHGRARRRSSSGSCRRPASRRNGSRACGWCRAAARA